MAENEWSRRLRAAFTAWPIVSAMSSTLITGYKFLSEHGNLVPAVAPGVGTLTLVVNACLFTAMLYFTGNISGFLFRYLVGKDRLGPTLLKLAVLLFLGVGFVFHSVSGAPAGTPVEPGSFFFGVICLVCVVLRLSPLARWAVEHDGETILASGSIITIAAFIFPGVTQSLWTLFLGDESRNAACGWRIVVSPIFP